MNSSDIPQIFDLSQLPRLPKSVVSIGNFDGVHLGHRALLREMVNFSQKQKIPSLAISFYPHPYQYFNPDKKLIRLQSLAAQKSEIQQLGVDHFICLNFNEDLAKLKAEDFCSDILIKQMGMLGLFVGDDFALGQGKQGNLQFLQNFCKAFNVYFYVQKSVSIAGLRVSSSRIRQALLEGQLELASDYLGKPYSIEATVSHGAKQGRQLGFPTANLVVEVPLKYGVYSCFAEYGSSTQLIPAIANYGLRPTFMSEKPELRLEVHLINFKKDIYGENLRIYFQKFYRDEKKFSSIDDLRQQIILDVQRRLDDMKQGFITQSGAEKK